MSEWPRASAAFHLSHPGHPSSSCSTSSGLPTPPFTTTRSVSSTRTVSSRHSCEPFAPAIEPVSSAPTLTHATEKDSRRNARSHEQTKDEAIRKPLKARADLAIRTEQSTLPFHYKLSACEGALWTSLMTS